MRTNSKKPKKQRKALFTYKNHQKSKLLTTRLADFLQEEYGVKRLPLRVGDQVRVLTGEFTDFEGEVLKITKKLGVQIKEATFQKADGTDWNPSIHISNLIITKFKKEGKDMDPWRSSMIDRKSVFGYEFGSELKGPKKEKNNEVEIKK
ncbi:MAG: 50S ribosomal protein L24 [Candidatus Lokiarchaeota archaeon]|nr:50S ribosomal protein L24 [Candidatus Lokiarchaeota archaeon]